MNTVIKPIDLDKVDMSNYKPIEPVPVKDLPGFYHIPDFSNYAIARDGRVINLKYKTIRRASRMGRYNAYCIIDDNGDNRKIPAHRLLLTVFDHPGISIDELQVNHIDGNCFNNDLSNLEWMTCRQNIRHSNDNGWAPKRVPCQIRHVKTNTVYQLPQMRLAAGIVGISKWEVVARFDHARVTDNDDKIWPEGWQYRRGYDHRPWLDVDPDDLSRVIEQQNGVSNRIVVRFYDTGEIKTYDTQNDACRELGISAAKLSQQADRPEQPLVTTDKGFVQFCRDANNVYFRPLGDFYEEIAKGNECLRLVQSRNPHTGEVKTYLSARECANKEGISYTNLNWWLKDTKIRSNGSQYRYYSKSTEW